MFGINNITNTFTELNRNNRKALIGYLVCGDPTIESNILACQQLFDAGLDILELGVPFSDPMADGTTIQDGHSRALAAGCNNLSMVLETVATLRKTGYKQPIILMGYLNTLGNINYNDKLQQCQEVGVDGLLIVDMPLEELAMFQRDCENTGLANIQLISPNTDAARMQKIVACCNGFVYYVSYRGVTGQSIINQNEISENISYLKTITTLPIVQGFGIKTPELARQACQVADGAVIGAALVEKSANLMQQIEFIKNCVQAINKQ